MNARLTPQVGDWLTFKAATRWNCVKVRRKVVGVDLYGRALVRYGGWSEFIVKPGEYLAVERPS